MTVGDDPTSTECEWKDSNDEGYPKEQHDDEVYDRAT